jgi:hypothetical protein
VPHAPRAVRRHTPRRHPEVLARTYVSPPWPHTATGPHAAESPRPQADWLSATASWAPTRAPPRAFRCHAFHARRTRSACLSLKPSRFAPRRASAGFQVFPAPSALSPRSSLRRRSSSGSPLPTPGRRSMSTRVRRQPQRRLDVQHERRGQTRRTPARARSAPFAGRLQGKKAASPLPCLNRNPVCS